MVFSGTLLCDPTYPQSSAFDHCSNIQKKIRLNTIQTRHNCTIKITYLDAGVGAAEPKRFDIFEDTPSLLLVAGEEAAPARGRDE